MAKKGCKYTIVTGKDAGKKFRSVEDVLRYLNAPSTQEAKPSVQPAPKPTKEQDERAQKYGYENTFQAVGSLNKNLGSDYSVTDFDQIPDSELEQASAVSETVKKKAAKEEKLSEIKSRRDDIKSRLAEKIRLSRSGLRSGIDPSILPDLIELGKTYVEEGVVKAADFISRIREDLREIGLDDKDIKDEEIISSVFEEASKEPGLSEPEEGSIYQKNDAYPEGKNETFPPTGETATGGSQKIKSVIDAYANRSNMPEDLRQGLIDQVGLYYTQLSNEQTFEMGQSIIDSMGLQQAVAEALSSPDMAPVLRVMILGSAINEYKKQQKAAKDQPIIDELSDKQNSLSDKLDVMARDYGRAIQLLRPIYLTSGVALKRKIQQEIDKRNTARKPVVNEVVKKIDEELRDEEITKEDLENASAYDKASLENRLKEAEKRIRELEKKQPSGQRKTYTRTVTKEQSDAALKALLGKAYAFPALDPEVFRNIKVVGTYVLESLIISGQNTYQNFHDTMSRKLRGKFKDAYAELYKDLVKGREGQSEREVGDAQAQIDYFDKVSKFVKSPDAAVVSILKKAGYTRTSVSGKESIDWTKVISDRTSLAGAVASLRKELSGLNLSRGQLNALERMAEERIGAAIDARKSRYISKLIEQNEKASITRALRKANRKSKIDKLVELSRIGALSQTKIRDIISDELGIIRLDDEAVRRIDELQEILEKAPTGFISSKIEEEITYITSQYKLDFWWEKLRERFFLRMLSGFATAIKNLTGAGVVFTRALQVGIRTKGQKRIVSVMGQQFKEATAVFSQVLLNGGVDKGIAFLDFTGQKAGIPRVRYSEYHKTNAPIISKPLRIKGRDVNPLNFLYNNEKYVGRVLGASDAFFQTLSSGLKQYQYEYLMQVRSNPEMSSSEAAQAAYNNLYSIALTDAKATAKKELESTGIKFNDRDVTRRAYEIIERARNPKTVERGETVAQQDAFKAPDGIGFFPMVSVVLSGVKRGTEIMAEQELVKDTPTATILIGFSRMIGDVVIPFVGGVSNVMEKSIELWPYGALKGGVHYAIASQLKNRGDADRADFYRDKSIDLMLRSAIGLTYFGITMAVMAMSRALTPEGEEEESYTGLFGSGSQKYTEEQINQYVRRKNTLRLFGADISLDYLGTLGLSLKGYALALDLERYDPEFKKGYNKDNFMTAMGALTASLLTDSFFESLGRFSGFISGPTKDSSKKYAESMLANLLATTVVPFTNFIRQTGQVVNPTSTYPTSLMDRIVKYSGLTFGYGLKPAIDYRGRSYDVGDIYASSADGLLKMLSQDFFKPDRIDSFLGLYKIAVTSPSRVESNPENNSLMIYNEDGTSRPLTEEEFYEYKKAKGEKLNELLEKHFTQLEEGARSLEAQYDKTKVENILQDYFSTYFNGPAKDYALYAVNEKFGSISEYNRNRKR